MMKRIKFGTDWSGESGACLRPPLALSATCVYPTSHRAFQCTNVQWANVLLIGGVTEVYSRKDPIIIFVSRHDTKFGGSLQK